MLLINIDNSPSSNSKYESTKYCQDQNAKTTLIFVLLHVPWCKFLFVFVNIKVCWSTIQIFKLKINTWTSAKTQFWTTGNFISSTASFRSDCLQNKTNEFTSHHSNLPSDFSVLWLAHNFSVCSVLLECCEKDQQEEQTSVRNAGALPVKPGQVWTVQMCQCEGSLCLLLVPAASHGTSAKQQKQPNKWEWWYAFSIINIARMLQCNGFHSDIKIPCGNMHIHTNLCNENILADKIMPDLFLAHKVAHMCRLLKLNANIIGDERLIYAPTDMCSNLMHG